MNNPNYEQFYNKIGYKFKDEKLLITALTHPSYANENGLEKTEHYQRFEFLGDSVLQLIISDELFHYFPNVLEGELTKHRASLVCENSLAECAKLIDLDKYILLGKGEEKERTNEKPSVLSDVFEALICAIYLDSDLEHAKEFIDRYIIANSNNVILDYKTIIQEFYKDKGYELNYKTTNEEGPAHNKKFTVALYYKDELLGVGTAKSKKEAEQIAASQCFHNKESEIRNVLKID